MQFLKQTLPPQTFVIAERLYLSLMEKEVEEHKQQMLAQTTNNRRMTATRYGVFTLSYEEWATNELLPLLKKQKLAWREFISDYLTAPNQIPLGLNAYEVVILYTRQMASIDRIMQGKDKAYHLYANYCNAIFNAR